MKQCIAEVLETQSEIIQLQRNVIDRLAATLLQQKMEQKGIRKNGLFNQIARRL